jgi:hypothetical protein
MVFEVATVLLGVGVGAVVVLYALARGYLGHRRRRESSEVTVDEAPMVSAYTPATEQVKAPIEVVPAKAEPAPSPAPPIYETVQPVVPPAPVTYAPSAPATFGGSAITRKPTRTYRRRSAPVRSTSPRSPRSTRRPKSTEQKK